MLRSTCQVYLSELPCYVRQALRPCSFAYSIHMYCILLLALGLVSVVAAQDLQRDNEALPIGPLSKKIPNTLGEGLGWGNASLELPSDNIFLADLGLSKRQSCGSGCEHLHMKSTNDPH
jgi:hypothetical protein